MSQRTKAAAPPSRCRRRFALVPLGPPLLTYSSTSKVGGWSACLSVVPEVLHRTRWAGGGLGPSGLASVCNAQPCQSNKTAPIGPCRTNPAAHAQFTGRRRSGRTRAVVFGAACLSSSFLSKRLPCFVIHLRRPCSSTTPRRGRCSWRWTGHTRRESRCWRGAARRCEAVALSGLACAPGQWALVCGLAQARHRKTCRRAIAPLCWEPNTLAPGRLKCARAHKCARRPGREARAQGPYKALG